MFEEQGSMAVDLANLSIRVGMKGNTNLNNDILKVFISMYNEINKLKDKVNKLENGIQIVYEGNEFKSKQEEYTRVIDSYERNEFINIANLLYDLSDKDLVGLTDLEILNEVNRNLTSAVKLIPVPGLHKFFIINYSIRLESLITLHLDLNNDDVEFIKTSDKKYVSNLEYIVQSNLDTTNKVRIDIMGVTYNNKDESSIQEIINLLPCDKNYRIKYNYTLPYSMKNVTLELYKNDDVLRCLTDGFKDVIFYLDDYDNDYDFNSSFIPLIYDDIIDVYKIEYLYNTGEDDESVC